MLSAGDCSKDWHGPIGSWDLSAVTDMSQMFQGARLFNQDLSNWDVSAAKDMSYMFNDAEKFNQDLSTWDVSAVTNMNHMFDGATSFKQALCGFAWRDSDALNLDMFSASPGSIASEPCKLTTGNS